MSFSCFDEMRKRKHRYFSQHGEDYLLWNFFNHKKTGFYVDVGAFDGVHLSNSFSFEQQGWSGICIEPHPTYFQLCKQSRPRAICLNVACVADDNIDTSEFYIEELGLLSGILGNRENDIRARYERRGLKFKGFKKVTVPASTLSAILSKHVSPETEIDFISIDVEGTEIEVLRGLNLTRFRPRIVVIEANSREEKDVIGTRMANNGYVEARSLGTNHFYVRDPVDIDSLQSTPVDCRIEKNLHPLGKKYTLPPHIEGKVIKEPSGPRKMLTHGKWWIMSKMLTLFRN